MKVFKKYIIFPIISLSLLGVAFLYNLLFALIAEVDPILHYSILFYFLPLIIGMLFVHFGIKNKSNLFIYIGHILNIVCSLIITIKIERLLFALVSDLPGVSLLFCCIWPLLLLGTSLTVMGFAKTVNFEKEHRIILLVSFFGLVLNALIVLIVIIIFAVRFEEVFVFFSFLPVILVFLSLISVAALPAYTTDMANLVEKSSAKSFFENLFNRTKFGKKKNTKTKEEEKIKEDVEEHLDEETTSEEKIIDVDVKN